MTLSMTGFSRIEAEGELGSLSIEIKSVNSRYLDIYFKIPEVLKSVEPLMRKQISEQLSRGKVECSIRYYAGGGEPLNINEPYVAALLATSTHLADTYDIEPIKVGELLRLPGVMVEKSLDGKALSQWVGSTLEQALVGLIEQRKNEGAHLQTLVLERIEKVKEILQLAQTNYQASTENIQQKLSVKLAELESHYRSQIDEQRFEQEMIYLLQKMDIAEELDRLAGHVSAVETLFSADYPIGRKLDFLMQEMNRESNTIASKSQHLGLTMNAVELKVLLEQMREQIQNIE